MVKTKTGVLLQKSLVLLEIFMKAGLILTHAQMSILLLMLLFPINCQWMVLVLLGITPEYMSTRHMEEIKIEEQAFMTGLRTVRRLTKNMGRKLLLLCQWQQTQSTGGNKHKALEGVRVRSS